MTVSGLNSRRTTACAATSRRRTSSTHLAHTYRTLAAHTPSARSYKNHTNKPPRRLIGLSWPTLSLPQPNQSNPSPLRQTHTGQHARPPSGRPIGQTNRQRANKTAVQWRRSVTYSLVAAACHCGPLHMARVLCWPGGGRKSIARQPSSSGRRRRCFPSAKLAFFGQCKPVATLSQHWSRARLAWGGLLS